MQKITATVPIIAKQNEQILVIERSKLFRSIPVWQGFCSVHYTDVVSSVLQNQHFMQRAQAENDPQYKQIIPYVILRHENHLFVVQRRSTASEQRLASKSSLGIGGHLRASDLINNNPFDWARRELHEEINGIHITQSTFFGFINDDSNAVGTVHFGIVYLADLAHRNIKVNSELKHGQWHCVHTMPTYDHFEPWSQLVLSALSR